MCVQGLWKRERVMDKGWGRGDEIARGQGLKRKYDLWENTGMMEIAKALK